MLNTKPIKKSVVAKSDIIDIPDDKILDNIALKTDKLDNNINNFKIDNILNNEKDVEKAVEQNPTQEQTIKHIPIPVTLPQYSFQQQQTAPIPPTHQQPMQNNFPSTLSNYTVSFDDEKNVYTITYNNNIESIFTHKDILDALLESNNSNYVIRQYLFIVSHNSETGVNEINFVNSPVTNSIEIMIKIQNYFYELLNSSTDNAELFDKLLFLYYQMIIYLFRNYPRYESYAKIQKFYSTLSFRFSSLVLKQIVELNKVNSEIDAKIQQIDDVKNNLIAQISGVPLTTETAQSEPTNDTQYTDSTNKTLSSLLSEATESDGLNSYIDMEKPIIKTTPSDGLTGFTVNDTDKNEFTSSQQLINKHGITNSNGVSVTNYDEIWNDDITAPVTVIEETTTHKKEPVKGGKLDSSTTSSSLSSSSSGSLSSSSERSDDSTTSPSYNEFSAKNNSKKYRVEL